MTCPPNATPSCVGMPHAGCAAAIVVAAIAGAANSAPNPNVNSGCASSDFRICE